MAQGGKRVVSCPTCGKPVVWEPESRFRPFCCARCKLIDLGQWATEQYRVPDEAGEDPAEPGERSSA
jgi:endogenous inhibitor of DNA gyrase (YacG/DUF329 family)